MWIEAAYDMGLACLEESSIYDSGTIVQIQKEKHFRAPLSNILFSHYLG